MAEPIKTEVDAISSTENSHVEAASPVATPASKKVTLHSEKQDVGEKDIGHVKPKGPSRNNSVYSSSGRKVSEWEALQMVAAGDYDTINREIDAVEADLVAMNIQSTWYKPQLKLSDPRYFTWLLVG